jgi:hypothetical protein
VAVASKFNRLPPFFFLVVAALLDCLPFVSCGGIKFGTMAVISVRVEAKNDARCATGLEEESTDGREGGWFVLRTQAKQPCCQEAVAPCSCTFSPPCMDDGPRPLTRIVNVKPDFVGNPAISLLDHVVFGPAHPLYLYDRRA